MEDLCRICKRPTTALAQGIWVGRVWMHRSCYLQDRTTELLPKKSWSQLMASLLKLFSF